MNRILPHLLLVALLWFGLGLGIKAVRAAELATFEVVARDGRLLPERLEVPAGVKLKLTLRNEGRAPVEFENLDLRVEKVLAPNATSFVVIHPLKPGSYPFVDEFHPETGKLLLIAK
jgi:hypothetical protein